MLDPDHRHPREREVFLDAAEIENAADRAAFLDASCGDDVHLRSRVEALLAADRAEDLVPPAEVDAVITEIGSEGETVDMTGMEIGPYKLVEELGEGGMGSVWRARQEVPIRREVAIKVIKLGMDTRELVARFEAERQVLAMLDHPNIASIHDAGSTEGGRPYFVMELVEGVPITDYCKGKALGVGERLKIFMEVCEAVEHAHRKGVIHRDLKPSNILVSKEGAMKVIDFGVAKLTPPDRAPRTLLTRDFSIIGTPGYMSPEQAGGERDIDTRADVYSLGALLYELLVGLPPFSREELRTAALEEVRRIIREDIPPRPSTRVTGVASPGGTGSRRSASRLKGDLDWIVMQALAKERERRYQTVDSLCEDIRRHLASEPVSAAAPTWSYRFSRIARKYRVGMAWAAVALLAVVGGGVLATVQAVRATKAERKEMAARLDMQLVLADTYVSEGMHEAETNEFARAKLWFEEAARLSAGDPERVQANRMRGKAFGEFAPFPLRMVEMPDEKCKVAGVHPSQPFVVVHLDGQRRNWVLDLDRERVLDPPGMPATGFKAVGFDPNSSRFATSSAGGQVTIRELPDGKVLEELDLEGEIGEISNLTWSQDGTLLFLGSTAARIYEVESGTLWPAVLDHEYPAGKDEQIRIADFGPGKRHLVTVGHFNHWTLKLFRLDPEARTAESILQHAGARHAGGELPVFLGGGRWLKGSTENGVSVFECESGRLLGRFSSGEHPPAGWPEDLRAEFVEHPALRYHISGRMDPLPGGRLAAMNHPARYVRWEDGSEVPRPGYMGPVRGFLGGNVSAPIAITHHGRSLFLWRVPQDERHWSLPCSEAAGPVFSRDGKFLSVAGPEQREVWVCEVATRALLEKRLVPGDRVRVLDFSPLAGDLMVLGLHGDPPEEPTIPPGNCRVELWNWRTASRVLGPVPLDSTPVAVRYHRSGEWLAVGTNAGEVFRINARTGERALLFKADAEQSFDLLLFVEEVGSAGTLIAGCRKGPRPTTTWVWDLASSSLKYPPLEHPPYQPGRRFDYRGGVLITPGGPHTFCDLASGAPLASPLADTLGDEGLVFGPSGNEVLVTGRQEGVRCVDWRTGAASGPDLIHGFRDARWVHRALPVPATPWVVVCGMNGARFFDPASGTVVAPPIEWKEARKLWRVPHCVLSPDGGTLAYNHNRKMIEMIDLSTLRSGPGESGEHDEALDEVRAGARVMRGGLSELKVQSEWPEQWRACRERHPELFHLE